MKRFDNSSACIEVPANRRKFLTERRSFCSRRSSISNYCSFDLWRMAWKENRQIFLHMCQHFTESYVLWVRNFLYPLAWRFQSNFASNKRSIHSWSIWIEPKPMAASESLNNICIYKYKRHTCVCFEKIRKSIPEVPLFCGQRISAQNRKAGAGKLE